MKIVFTCGCFDVLHAGHVEFLRQARSFGDALVVGINTDASVKGLKGHKRPINTLIDRILVLQSIRWVDTVVAFDELTPDEIVKEIRPDIIIKGPGYNIETVPEAQVAAAWGAKFVSLPGPRISTTDIIEKIKRNA